MDTDGFLHKYFLSNPGKRIHKWVHYFNIYEQHLERFRGKSPVMIEIGVAGGGSIEMWRAYFGEGAKIIGIDINEDCKIHESKDIEVVIGSQDDESIANYILSKYGCIDILLDDGCHLSPYMIKTFEIYYSRLSSTGVYIVEDTHANYWDDWGGGLSRPGTFMEFAKARIDDLNACHTRGALPISDVTHSTASINFYDSVVVFEKRPQGFRDAPITRGMLTP